MERSERRRRVLTAHFPPTPDHHRPVRRDPSLSTPARAGRRTTSGGSCAAGFRSGAAGALRPCHGTAPSGLRSFDGAPAAAARGSAAAAAAATGRAGPARSTRAWAYGPRRHSQRAHQPPPCPLRRGRRRGPPAAAPAPGAGAAGRPAAFACGGRGGPGAVDDGAAAGAAEGAAGEGVGAAGGRQRVVPAAAAGGGGGAGGAAAAADDVAAVRVLCIRALMSMTDGPERVYYPHHNRPTQSPNPHPTHTGRPCPSP